MLSNIAHMIVFKFHLIQLTLLFYVVVLNNGMRKPSQRIQVLLIIFRKFFTLVLCCILNKSIKSTLILFEFEYVNIVFRTPISP